MRRCFVCALILALLFSAATTVTTAQTSRATIRGIVKDPNGAVIPGAQLKLINEETQETRTAQSGTEGEFAFSSLMPGSYRLEISATGFAAFTRENIVLQVNQEFRLDAPLAVRGVVTADYISDTLPSPLRKDSAALGTVIDNRQVTGLPLDGRNFYEVN